MMPPVKWREVRGANARNHIWGIEIEPDCPFGTLAQEVAEWQAKAAVFIPAGLAAAALLGFGGWQIAGAFTAVLGALIGLAGGTVVANNLVSGTRGLEYWGRAVDVVAGGDLERLARELSGYGQFRGAVPLETIKAEILAREADAKRWFSRNRKALDRAYAERPQP